MFRIEGHPQRAIMMSSSYHGGMTKRLQFRLDPLDLEALREFAHRRGLTLSAAVRALIRERLGPRAEPPAEVVRRFLAAAGFIPGAPGEGTVSRDHDEALYGRPLE